ncbi:MAG: outer membrane protein assembly factor BamD [Beggiatoa sp. IS2]|nr:MAG: outer membrane protein assembly factor BamD [Beggiatoa sp. IS2]
MKIITLLLISCLAGCALFSEEGDETTKLTIDQIYAQAKEAMNDGSYETAIKLYEALEARDPFGKYAQQAQLDIIYAYYKYQEPDSALTAAARFIKLYPRHPRIDYAYYLKGLVNFELNAGLFDRFLPLDKSQRDQTAAMNAFNGFSDLITRFPDSKYSEDARQRMVYLRNILADYELHAARFYLERGAFVAAANRAKKVVESYQRTPAVPEALVILAKTYKIMSLADLYTSTLRVLKLNYPDYPGIQEVENLAVKG